MKHKKSLALLASAAMTASTFSPAFALPAMAEEAVKKYKDGTYTATATVTDEEEFDYDISVAVTVSGGLITDLTADKTEDRSADPESNDSYLKRAVEGTSKKTGIKEQLVTKSSENGGVVDVDSVDAVSNATYSSNAVKKAAKEALDGAVEETPVVTVDKTALQSKVDEVNAKGYAEADYTADSWSAFQSALSTASTVLANADATQTEVDEALSALNTAEAGLTAAVKVDKTALNEAIEKAEALTADGYTADSWSALQSALSAAKEVQASESAAQDEVDSAAAALNEAISKLETEDLYVLMNIPYNEFYDAIGATVEADAVSGATAKVRNAGVAGGSYNGGGNATNLEDVTDTAKGVQYPVKVEDASLLTGAEVTDDTTYSVAYSGRGQTTEATLTGRAALIQADDYAYYVLSEVPENYVELTADGISEVKGGTKTSSTVVAEVEYGSHWGDYQIALSDDDTLTGATVYAAAIVTGAGTYGMIHLDNIWRNAEIAWNAEGVYADTNGTTLESVVYYTDAGVYSVALNETLKSIYSGEITASLKDSTGTVTGLPSDISGATATVSYKEGRNTTVYIENAPIAADGTFEISGLINGTQYTVQVNSDNYAPLTASNVEYSGPFYVLMNIPYQDFYAAEIENDVAVDAVTSATKSKTLNSGLVAGSYHVNSDGTDITGIIYPVKVNEEDELSGLTAVTDETTVTVSGTEYTGSGALFESASYSYYVLSSVPSFYKEMTTAADGTKSFSAAAASAVTALSEASAEISDTSNYGDYQINVSGLPDDIGNISAVVLKTSDGAGYGLRHLENIWRKSQLAFSTGFTTTAHGSPLSADHYVSIMGKTITEIVYYTQDAEYTISTELYVPIKTDASVSVTDGASGTGSVAVTFENLPDGYEPEITVSGLETGFDGTALSYTDAKPGSYTAAVTDKSGKYASMKASFVLSTETVTAAYNNDPNMPALVAAQGVTEEDFANFLTNVTSVSVNGTAYAASGRNATKLFDSNGRLDITAKAFSDLTKGSGYTISVESTGYPTVSFTYSVPDTIYAYASLSYAEYWAAEGVYAAGSTASSSELDARNEADKGAFDAVSRATKNHGLHRGSFQQVAVIHTTTDEGASKDFEIASWDDKNTLVLTDGTSVSFDSGTITYTVRNGRNSVTHTATMTGYEITGIKYVPVGIPAEEFTAFIADYAVTINGKTLSGGFGENQLSSYSVTAYVTANTNGLKTVVKSAGGYGFTARKTGTDSGILSTAQSVVTDANLTKTLKSGEDIGSFGEFIRLDLTNAGDVNEYGALGSRMQTVRWTYYGSDSTYTKAVATYGTKFAADNWMHKSMGIQLGLTDSLRCQLPSGMDGTGYWTVTIYALGYQDYTVQLNVTADNLKIEKKTPSTDQPGQTPLPTVPADNGTDNSTNNNGSSNSSSGSTSTATAAPTAAPAAVSVPQTGDSSNPLAWAVACAVSACGLGVVLYRRRRE